MSYSFLEFERAGAVGIVTLNRPRCLNAVNFAMRDELRHFLTERQSDRETTVLVLTGAGRGFCAGLDIRDPAIVEATGGYGPRAAYEHQRQFSELIVMMRRCPQPIVGALKGPAAGAGFSMAMACDVRVVGRSASFIAAYLNLGLGGADMGSSWLLPRIVGSGNAARYLLTGEPLGADEALRIGFAQTLVDDDAVLDEAMRLANVMATKSPLGLRLTKEALHRNIGAISFEDAIALEDRNQAMCIAELTGKSR